jgi:hypothetical protein
MNWKYIYGFKNNIYWGWVLIYIKMLIFEISKKDLLILLLNYVR